MSFPLDVIAIERKREALRLQEWARSCLSKHYYTCSETARHGIKRIWRNRKVRLYSYHCKHCGGYHLTSRPQE